MQLYRLLPSTDHSWATSSIESLKLLRGLKRGAFNQIVVARVELARLIVFSAIEFSVHVSAAAVKIAAAVIQLPLYPLFGGVHPRVALVDAGSHLAHSVKLVVAIPCATLLGLAHPEWSIGLYQKLSLVKQPQGPFASAIDRLSIAAKAVWALPGRNEVLLTLATASTVVGGYFLRATRAHNPYALLQLVGTAVGCGVTGLGLGAACLYLCSKPAAKPMRPLPQTGSDQLLPGRTIEFALTRNGRRMPATITEVLPKGLRFTTELGLAYAPLRKLHGLQVLPLDTAPVVPRDHVTGEESQQSK